MSEDSSPGKTDNLPKDETSDKENTSQEDSNKYDELVQKNYEYPDPSDPDIQYKIYKKREFVYHKIPERELMTKYEDIKEYRDNVCGKMSTLHKHQAMLSNFISPETPYKGILLFHGLGSGKTCAGISIAERFKTMVQKYGTKIYILVNGPLLKENWKKELISQWCTGETYMKYTDKSTIIDKVEEAKNIKIAMNNALQYYRFMSYRSFYKRVLGEKIPEKSIVGEDGKKTKVVYRKNEEGEFERDISVDRIYNLNNSLIIVDEAHNLTKNNYGEALKKIIDNSFNLKVVLLSATPMKNLADDIVELLNFIRPKDKQIMRDRIFTTDKIDQIEIKPGGMDYFKNMARGYVSHIRGADPLTYAKRVDKGVIPDGLLFTKVVRCKMMNFQRTIYENAIKEVEEDALDRKSEAVANFAFPALTTNRKEITGVYGREGLNILKNQLKSNYDLLNTKIGTSLFKKKQESDFLSLSGDGKMISGNIFNIRYLKYFSAKFYKAMKKLNRLIWGKKGAKTAFVYSNLVKVGIELFQEVLVQNGYLEFQENSANYRIKNDTVCYYCGRTYKDHDNFEVEVPISRPKKRISKKKLRKLNKIKSKLNSKHHQKGGEDEDNEEAIEDEVEAEEVNSETEDEETEQKIELKGYDDLKDEYIRSASSSDYSPYKQHMTTKTLPKHQFYPATFLVITGKSSEESAEYLPEDKKNIIDNVFNKIENKEGKHLKFILGSKVMNEGISLKNVGEVHILDVYFNLGKIDQTIGRAIRYCSHYNVMGENNQFPYVNVYRYVVSLDKGLSSEEELYRKAELKYKLIKMIERAMKEVAIDCPLNLHGNMFKEEMNEHKNCGKHGEAPCPVGCDFTSCDYKCDDLKLNGEFYDPNRNIYKMVSKDKLDTTTFTNALARSEIKYAKNKIKELYLKKYVYTIEEILKYVKESYTVDTRDMFDEFFVYRALDELIPLTENDFNNYQDTILDKFNRQGYLIYVKKYYIFQPFNQNEDVPMYYRTTYDKEILQQLGLSNYLKNNDKFNKFKNERNIVSDTVEDSKATGYDFESVMDYYDNRDEFKVVGIIDKETGKNIKNEEGDIFKIRENRAKILDKKRGTGIPSIHGAVCATAKSKEYLEKVIKDLDIKVDKSGMRTTMCDLIMTKLMELEKYSTGKERKTYMMVPANHPTIPFPLNLQDRSEYIKDKLTNEIKVKFDMEINTKKIQDGKYKGNTNYEIIIKNSDKIKDYHQVIEKYGGKLVKNNWIINIE